MKHSMIVYTCRQYTCMQTIHTQTIHTDQVMSALTFLAPCYEYCHEVMIWQGSWQGNLRSRLIANYS